MLAVSIARRRPGVTDVDFSLWTGLFALAGMPPTVIAQISTEVKTIIAGPAIRGRFVQEGGRYGPTDLRTLS